MFQQKNVEILPLGLLVEPHFPCLGLEQDAEVEVLDVHTVEVVDLHLYPEVEVEVVDLHQIPEVVLVMHLHSMPEVALDLHQLKKKTLEN